MKNQIKFLLPSLLGVFVSIGAIGVSFWALRMIWQMALCLFIFGMGMLFCIYLAISTAWDRARKEAGDLAASLTKLAIFLTRHKALGSKTPDDQDSLWKEMERDFKIASELPRKSSGKANRDD